MDFVTYNFDKAMLEAESFKFDAECYNCKSNMVKFSSDDKYIFFCENCGCIYLPEEVRCIKPSSYKYKKHIGVFVPVFEKPTLKQKGYLRNLLRATGEDENIIESITKEEARALINELKDKVPKTSLYNCYEYEDTHRDQYDDYKNEEYYHMLSILNEE